MGLKGVRSEQSRPSRRCLAADAGGYLDTFLYVRGATACLDTGEKGYFVGICAEALRVVNAAAPSGEFFLGATSRARRNVADRVGRG